MQVGDNLLCVSDNLKHCQCKLVEDHDEEALSSALRIIGSDRIGSGGVGARTQSFECHRNFSCNFSDIISRHFIEIMRNLLLSSHGDLKSLNAKYKTGPITEAERIALAVHKYKIETAFSTVLRL